MISRLLAIRSVPSHVIVMTALASYAGQLLAALQGWPLWGIAAVTILPWIPLFTVETAFTWRHFGWLALFYVLVITQGGHFLEHVVQVVQIHFLGLKPPEARGIFGMLDVEWVHFGFNSWVLIATALLVSRFRRNPWLWILLAWAIFHEVEHSVMLSAYLRTGKPGHPGLLAQGGVIGGGLPIRRPDLHFLYNLLEMVPLMMGFVWQLSRSYNEWLKRAFPHVTEQMLTETTRALQTLRFEPGQVIVRQGEASDRFYIVSRGEVEVLRRDGDGEKPIATLRAGQYFGEIGLLASAPRIASVRARTGVELLALDRESFRSLVETSEATADDLARLAQRRTSEAVGN